MARLQRVGFNFSIQFSSFGFIPEGSLGTAVYDQWYFPLFTFTQPAVTFNTRGNLATAVVGSTNTQSRFPYFVFTKQFDTFYSVGQASGTTPPPVSGGEQFLIGGPDLTEQFVTGGRLSVGGVSYTINPLSKRTV